MFLGGNQPLNPKFGDIEVGKDAPPSCQTPVVPRLQMRAAALGRGVDFQRERATLLGVSSG